MTANECSSRHLDSDTGPKHFARLCGGITKRLPWLGFAAPLLAFAFLFVCSSLACAQGQVLDKENDYRAVEFCRGAVVRPIALNIDQTTVCLDGKIDKETDLAPVKKLKEGGLFVVRSTGGDIASAVALSNLLGARRATVIVYDYCLASCANYLLIASDRAYVLKEALVAWDYESTDPALPFCSRYTMKRMRNGESRLQRGSCWPMPKDEADWRRVVLAQNKFFKRRMVDPLFEAPPDNRYVRKVANNPYSDSTEYHHVAWTLHPRYFDRLFKTKVIYEHYPESQADVDDMVSRFHLKMKVIYDP